MRRRQRQKGRPVHGILLLDKPTGMTSNEALQQVKHLYKARKAGHTGSLDPLASGLLPVCMGEATKASGFLLDADKHYRMTCRLGVRTATGDAEGEILETLSVSEFDRKAIETVLHKFLGPIQQIPPMYSAVKHQGERLYKLARQGLEVDREPRTVMIRELELLGMALPDVELDVRCSKGTYVRALAEDIGATLRCGAHVASLRRLGVGPYDEAGMVTMENLKKLGAQGLEGLDALVLPVETALAQWPGIRLSSDAAFYLRQGQPVLVPHAPTSGWVRLYQGENHFLGMGQILDDGRVAPKRLMNLT